MSYIPPIYQKEAFNCPSCNAFAHQHWFSIAAGKYHALNQDSFQVQTPIRGFKIARCAHCKNISYWMDSKMIYPIISAIVNPISDLPDECKSDYNEARNIINNSPRGAAALLRLCIQKLMTYLGESGENINQDIKNLVTKGLPSQVQQALDICRVVGNNAVHPGEIDLNDTPEVAHQLFELINFIVEQQITQPKKISDMFNNLPKGAIAAIEKRDTK